jgi:MFS family permease
MGLALGAIIGVMLGGFLSILGVKLWVNSGPMSWRSADPTWLLVPLLLGLGGALIGLMVVLTFEREEIHNHGSQIVFGRRFGAWLRRATIVDKTSIEQIATKPNPNDDMRGHDLFVRSPGALVHLGRGLTPQEQEWLQATLVSWLKP